MTTVAQQTAYERDGFVAPIDIFTADELAQIHAELDAAEALRERCIQAEQRAEEFERAASVESAERKAMEEELDRARERATLSERRAANIGAAKEMETRSAEAAATAATGEAASWRAAAEVGERGIIAAAEALQEWAEEIEREAARTRSPRKGLGTPKMSPKKLGLLASPLSSSLKSPHSMSPSNPVAFLRRVDGSPGLAPEEEAARAQEADGQATRIPRMSYKKHGSA